MMQNKSGITSKKISPNVMHKANKREQRYLLLLFCANVAFLAALIRNVLVESPKLAKLVEVALICSDCDQVALAHHAWSMLALTPAVDTNGQTVR